MSNKKKKKSKKTLDMDIDEEIIIGYNSNRKRDNPPKSKRKKKKKRKNRWNKIKKVLLVLVKIILILAVIIGIAVFLFVSPVFNITEIRVENAEKISKNTYIVLSEIELGQNIFRISKNKIKTSIKTESYVEELEVKRELPNTIVLTVKERKPEYMIKNNGMYTYIDKNGYILEDNSKALDLPILKGTYTDLSKVQLGNRMDEDDLSKFNDLIRIIDGIKNNGIEEKLTSIDISDHNRYILEFKKAKKTVILGDISNLSTKMLWIKHLIETRKGEEGTIHLDAENTYFSPAEEQNVIGG